MNNLKGKVAFVSGAGSGIGLGIATALARAGATVALGDIRAAAVQEAQRQIVKNGGRALAVTVDVSRRESVAAAADAVEDACGAIHIVVNNAGVAMHGVPLEAIPAADWDWVIGVNIYGVIHGIQVFLPYIRRHGEGGHIINTASIGGFQVRPDWHTSAYSMTKYAVVALSEALEQELQGGNIGVSVLAPAAVATGIHLSGRSRPEQFGGVCERPELAFMGELIKDGLNPAAVGERVVQAIKNNEFYIFTHAAPRRWLAARQARIDAAFEQAAGDVIS